MAQQVINIGVAPNSNTGDPLRIALTKVNDNFAEVYGSILPVQAGNNGKFLTTNGSSASWSDIPTLNQNTTGSAASLSGTATTAIISSALGTGTADSTTFLRGDRSWAVVSLPSGQTAGSSTAGYIQYSGTTATSGQINGSTTDPTGTLRLNFEGYLYATRFYGDGSNVTNVAAASVANGVYTTSSYSDPSWITSLGETKVLPAQTGNNGKFLTTNGTSSSWADIPTLNQNTTGSAASLSGTATSAILSSALGTGTADTTTFLRGDRSWATVSLPSGQTAGSATAGYLQYSGTAKTNGQLYGGTDAPTNTTRLNFDGNLYATNFFGSGVFTALKEVRVAMPANDIDLNQGNYFSKTITTSTVFTVSNVPASGTVVSFILDLTNGGSNSITWWSNVRWQAGIAPTLTASGRDLLGFFTHDGGTNWNGLILAKDIK